MLADAGHDLPHAPAAHLDREHPEAVGRLGVRLHGPHHAHAQVGAEERLGRLTLVGGSLVLRAAKARAQGGHLLVGDGAEEELGLAERVALGQRELKAVRDAVGRVAVLQPEHPEDLGREGGCESGGAKAEEEARA